ncbi:hypothetical protein FRX31_031509 [Thalictrum thalictroides]|uniref:Uncharacterized protein n=1 Tax=Thalictrum thalictroides TaxID=46969 RepID=A0A7J6V227_THATH|nr:hypothetical protein FRX31_031509 [Thalictrum thalictroides]
MVFHSMDCNTFTMTLNTSGASLGNLGQTASSDFIPTATTFLAEAVALRLGLMMAIKVGVMREVNQVVDVLAKYAVRSSSFWFWDSGPPDIIKPMLAANLMGKTTPRCIKSVISTI